MDVKVPPTGEQQQQQPQPRLNRGKALISSTRKQIETLSQEKYGGFEWIARLIVFLVNFASAITLLVLCTQNSTACMVNYTYRQDMALNVVGNPYYSSTHTWRKGPPSKLESRYYGVANYTQEASDVMMFPNIVAKEFENAAFLPVRPSINLMIGAGEYLAHEYTADEYYFFWDHDLLGIRPVNLPMRAETATPTVLAQILGPPRPGMQVPNLYRCAENIYGSTEADIERGVEEMAKNSHLRGACLLSGQQHTVDISSNYRSSMIFFSSINPMFMVAVVCWICASFSLFELGHDTGTLTLPKYATVSDIAFAVSTLWNVALMVLAIVPDARKSWHIPLNNSLIAEVLLVGTILVQWRIATKLADKNVKESHAAAAVANSVDSSGEPVPYGIPVPQNENNETAIPEASIDNSILVCTASSFLSAAAGRSSFEDVEMARSRGSAKHEGAEGAHYSRRRADVPLLPRVPNPPIGSPFENMPYFHHMVKTGDLFVVGNYLQEIRSSSNLDCIQHIEFVLTIPLLFTVITGSSVSFIPTGVLQQIFVMMMVSHMLCAPILFVSRRTFDLDQNFQKDMERYNAATLRSGQASPPINVYKVNHYAVALLFVAFFMMQVTAIVAQWTYMQWTWEYYESNQGLFKAAAALLTGLQGILISMVFVICLPSMFVFFPSFAPNSDNFPSIGAVVYLESGCSYVLRNGWIVYFFLGFMLRIILIWIIYAASFQKDFSLYSCDVWEGKYAAY
jgi:hypothetical protein